METQTSHEFRTCPLYRHDPERFEAFIMEYGDLVQSAIRETVSGTERHVFVLLRNLARRAGEHDAVPQDLIAIHLAALSVIVRTKPRSVARASIRQSRLLLVKMLGELALFYREQAMGRR